MSKTNSIVLLVLLVFCFASFVVPGCGGGGSSGGGGGYSSAGGGGYDPITPTTSPTTSPTPTTSPIPAGMARIIVTFQPAKTAKALTGYLYQQGTIDPIQTFQLVNNQAILDVLPGWYRIVIDDNSTLYYDPNPTEFFYIGVGEERASIPVIYIPPSPSPSPSPTTSPTSSPSPSPSPTETPGPGPQPPPPPTPTPTPTPSPSPSPSPTPSPTMGKITVHLSNFNCMGNLYKEGVSGVFLTFELKNGTGSLTVSPGNYRVGVFNQGINYLDPTSTSYFTIVAGDDYQSYPAP